MKFYFCYEQTSSGVWGPVLYHNNPPSIKNGYQYSSNGIGKPTTVPVELDLDNEPSFAWLQRTYPMVKPTSGFRTADGQFFEDKNEAEIHEVTYKLFEPMREFLNKIEGFEGAPPEAIVTKGLEFVRNNVSLFKRYVDVIELIDGEKAPSLEDEHVQVAGSAAA